jgi:hypothetical protein
MKRTGILALALILGTVAPNLVFAQTSDVNKNGSRAMDMKGMDTKSTDMKGKEMNKGAPTTGHTGHGVVRSVNNGGRHRHACPRTNQDPWVAGDDDGLQGPE